MALTSGNSLSAPQSATEFVETPNTWKLLASVTADSSASLEINGFINSEYTTYKVLLDNLSYDSPAYLQMRVFLNNTEENGSVYGFNGWAGMGNSISNSNSAGSSSWLLTNQNADHNITGEITLIAAEASKKAIATWFLGAGTSTADAGFYNYSGILNNTDQVTGLKIYATNGNIAGGSMKLYGLN